MARYFELSVEIALISEDCLNFLARDSIDGVIGKFFDYADDVLTQMVLMDLVH